MKNVLFSLGLLALIAGCSRPGEDASWRGFNATPGTSTCASNVDCKAFGGRDGETGQGASVGQSKTHGNVIDKGDQGDQRRRARRDRMRRRAV